MTLETFGMSGSDEHEEEEKKPNPKRIIGFLCSMAILSFIILTLTNHLVSLLAALYQVPQDLPSRWHIYAWFNTTYIVVTLREASVLAYFLFIVFCILASFFWVTRKEGIEAGVALKDAILFKKNLPINPNNSIIMMFQLLFVYFFFFTVYWHIMAQIGVNFTLYPDNDYTIPTREIYRLTNAPVYEEFFFRTLLIGVPLYIIAFIMFFAGHRKKIPSPRRFFLGGGSDFGAYTVLFLVISSLFFAYAHVQLSAQEPAIALLPPTLLAGLILGYLFLEKGIHMAITFHFIVNYMFMLTYMDNADMVMTPLNLVFQSLTTAAFYLVIIFGVVAGPFYFLHYSRITLLLVKSGAEQVGLVEGKGDKKAKEQKL